MKMSLLVSGVYAISILFTGCVTVDGGVKTANNTSSPARLEIQISESDSRTSNELRLHLSVNTLASISKAEIKIAELPQELRLASTNGVATLDKVDLISSPLAVSKLDVGVPWQHDVVFSVGAVNKPLTLTLLLHFKEPGIEVNQKRHIYLRPAKDNSNFEASLDSNFGQSAPVSVVNSAPVVIGTISTATIEVISAGKSSNP